MMRKLITEGLTDEQLHRVQGYIDAIRDPLNGLVSWPNDVAKKTALIKALRESGIASKFPDDVVAWQRQMRHGNADEAQDPS